MTTTQPRTTPGAPAQELTHISGDGPGETSTASKSVIHNALSDARDRTLSLLADLSDRDLIQQHSPLMSPLVWDLAHIGNYEESWLLNKVSGRPTTSPHYDSMYDAFEHARSSRPGLPLLDPQQARAYVDMVRNNVLQVLDQISLAPDNPLLNNGFVYGLVSQHEHQHIETMLATLQILGANSPGRQTFLPPNKHDSPTLHDLPASPTRTEIFFDQTVATIGLPAESPAWVYDNEKAQHEVVLEPFALDIVPVSNADYLAFVLDGGYDRESLWTAAGWQWRQEANLIAPQYWERITSDDWLVNRFGEVMPLPLAEPVQHVCWYEADAFARWTGKRLPTEFEWEHAAQEATDATLAANLGAELNGPGSAHAPAFSADPVCLQMIGDVWEWTSSDFRQYPGFAAFPYEEYSEVFFGDEYKVLRGGSWATHPLAIRPTFRNWDYPIRRQIFAGLRCARSLSSNGSHSSFSTDRIPTRSPIIIESALDSENASEALRKDVLNGLSQTQKELPPKWFYDEVGSHLFEDITRLPEYYLTRTEISILENHAAEIVAASGADTLVELGSGACRKTRLLLDAMRDNGQLKRFVPFDVSESFLTKTAYDVADAYRGIAVHGVVGDFETHLDRIPQLGRRLVIFIGSTIGNLSPGQRAEFFAGIRANLTPEDSFLLGIDLVKDVGRLEAAYNDSAGVTAQFNLNMLKVINRELNANFDLTKFAHQARFDPANSWIEMLLISADDQVVEIKDLDLTVSFTKDEALRTEISTKFQRVTIESELAAADLHISGWWTDQESLPDFALLLAQPIPSK